MVDLDFDFNSQQTLGCIAKEAEIQDFIPLDDSDQPLPPHVGSRVSGKSTDHVAIDMKSTLVSAEVIAKHLLAKETNNPGGSLMALEVFKPKFCGCSKGELRGVL